jgi:hypothetical protein
MKHGLSVKWLIFLLALVGVCGCDQQSPQPGGTVDNVAGGEAETTAITMFSEMAERLRTEGTSLPDSRPRDVQTYVAVGRQIDSAKVGWIRELDANADARIPMADLTKRGIILLPHLEDMRKVRHVILSQLAVAAQDGDLDSVVAWMRAATALHHHASKLPFMVEGSFAIELATDIIVIIKTTNVLSNVTLEQRAAIHELAIALKHQHIDSAITSLNGERDCVVAIIRTGNSETFPLDRDEWRSITRNQDATIQEVSSVYAVAIRSISDTGVSSKSTADAIATTTVETSTYFTAYVPAYIDRIAAGLIELDNLIKETK